MEVVFYGKQGKKKGLLSRISSPEEAAGLIKDGMTVAFGGYTPSGYPKVITGELVKRKNNGDDFKINVITGANVGPEIDDALGQAKLINRRSPLQGCRELGNSINKGFVKYIEVPLNKMPRTVRCGLLGKIDVAVIEAIAITEDGNIVPGPAVGMDPIFVEAADTVIVEINSAQLAELEGMHDIYISDLPPNKKPVPLTYTNERIGQPFIKVDPEKIKCIVASDIPDCTPIFAKEDQTSQRLATNLLNFLELEVASKRMPKLLPLQSGLGNSANALVKAFEKSNFQDIEFYCGVLQEANIELIATGKVKAASGGSFTSSPVVMDLLRKNPQLYKEEMVLRPSDISNNAEIISRLGLITLNNAIELDIYGNANTSHIAGNKVVNGIGGGASFAQNAFLSVMLLPSTSKGGDISTIVPMATHNDISEHDLDIIVTENGVADLRGKDPVERAQCVIDNCASEIYKAQLNSYLQKSIKNAGGHQPVLLDEAFSWYKRLKETGSMKE